jgi:hypothetical protein
VIGLKGDNGHEPSGETDMRVRQLVFEKSWRRTLTSIAASAIFALVMSQADTASAQPVELKTFPSAGEASLALYRAVENHDEPAIEAILGAGTEVTSTTDDDDDKAERRQFCEKYEEMHRLVEEPDGAIVLYIGAENWPFPVPLASKNGVWFFDAQTGRQEILFRRIGENEATAIEASLALAGAATAQATDGGSDDPIRQFVERVASGGNRGDSDEPFYGYYFRALSGPAAATTGGTSGAVTRAGRPAFVAYPAEYRRSGVMTFIVTSNNTVLEKDLGPETPTLAKEIRTDKPVTGWRAVK